jgi:hypothetical protein
MTRKRPTSPSRGNGSEERMPTKANAATLGPRERAAARNSSGRTASLSVGGMALIEDHLDNLRLTRRATRQRLVSKNEIRHRGLLFDSAHSSHSSRAVYRDGPEVRLCLVVLPDPADAQSQGKPRRLLGDNRRRGACSDDLCRDRSLRRDQIIERLTLESLPPHSGGFDRHSGDCPGAPMGGRMRPPRRIWKPAHA